MILGVALWCCREDACSLTMVLIWCWYRADPRSKAMVMRTTMLMMLTMFTIPIMKSNMKITSTVAMMMTATMPFMFNGDGHGHGDGDDDTASY